MMDMKYKPSSKDKKDPVDICLVDDSIGKGRSMKMLIDMLRERYI